MRGNVYWEAQHFLRTLCFVGSLYISVYFLRYMCTVGYSKNPFFCLGHMHQDFLDFPPPQVPFFLHQSGCGMRVYDTEMGCPKWADSTVYPPHATNRALFFTSHFPPHKKSFKEFFLVRCFANFCFYFYSKKNVMCLSGALHFFWFVYFFFFWVNCDTTYTFFFDLR